MFRQLVLMKQMLQKPLRYKAVAQKTRSACLGLRFAGWQLCAVADGVTPLKAPSREGEGVKPVLYAFKLSSVR